jgi:hypothetical protein
VTYLFTCLAGFTGLSRSGSIPQGVDAVEDALSIQHLLQRRSPAQIQAHGANKEDGTMKLGTLQETLISCFKDVEFPPLLVLGKPGGGKTVSVRWSVKECIHDDGLPYDLLIIHPVGRDQSFIGGYPTIVNDEDGVPRALHIAYAELEQLRDATRPLVCFIDDFGLCSPTVQGAFQQLILERSYNGVHVSDHVRFVLASNRREDRAGVQQVIESIVSRCIVVQVESDVERTVRWLSEAYPEVPEVGAFLIKRPQFLTDPSASEDEDSRRGAISGKVSERTIEFCAQVRLKKFPAPVELELLSGAAGRAFAAEFQGFCSIWKTLLPLREVLANPATARLPGGPHEYYAEAGSLVHAATRDNLPKIDKYVSRWNAEYKEYFFKLIEVQKSALCETAEYINHKTTSRY